MVAPRAGAWVEMARHGRVKGSSVVAPRAGAWVEITIISCLIAGVPSLLVQGRGLKFPICKPHKSVFCRSSCRGVG